MKKADILIIGAGAAGLMAARLLARAGKKVIVLEARERCGGRIHTIEDESYFKHAELGAEFVHGDLPLTLGLLNEVGIPYNSANAEMWQYKDGKFSREVSFMEDWDLLIERLGKLTGDMSIDEFLKMEFPANSVLRDAVWKFVSGYDTGDPCKASAFALRSEWQNEDTGAQHRIQGGYGALIKYLVDECKDAGGHICLNSVVNEIQWQNGNARAVTDAGTVYEASQVLIAVPLGILQAGNEKKGAINFSPPIPDQSHALATMGFGAVIKILLKFEDAFWQDKFTENIAGKNLTGMGYLFSDEEIPTWWTQAPQHSAVLTGWIGGPAAEEKKHVPDEALLAESLQSLSNIFNRDLAELKNKLIAFKIANWTIETFTRGSYAYDTVESPESRKLLNASVGNTIFFAGDYLYEGPAMGTVEAALTSGNDAAERMLKPWSFSV